MDYLKNCVGRFTLNVTNFEISVFKVELSDQKSQYCFEIASTLPLPLRNGQDRNDSDFFITSWRRTHKKTLSEIENPKVYFFRRFSME